jgi:hypothetical protein
MVIFVVISKNEEYQSDINLTRGIGQVSLYPMPVTKQLVLKAESGPQPYVLRHPSGDSKRIPSGGG